MEKVCPLCGIGYVDWALHVDEALGSCALIDRGCPEDYFGSASTEKREGIRSGWLTP